MLFTRFPGKNLAGVSRQLGGLFDLSATAETDAANQ
jgi:hypothetical protein